MPGFSRCCSGIGPSGSSCVPACTACGFSSLSCFFSLALAFSRRSISCWMRRCSAAVDSAAWRKCCICSSVIVLRIPVHVVPPSPGSGKSPHAPPPRLRPSRLRRRRDVPRSRGLPLLAALGLLPLRLRPLQVFVREDALVGVRSVRAAGLEAQRVHVRRGLLAPVVQELP